MDTAGSKRITDWGLRTVVAAGVLAVALLAPRAYILQKSGFGEWPSRRPIIDFARLCFSGTYDTAFAIGLAVIFLAILMPLRRQKAAGMVIYRVFLLVATLCLLAGLINAKVIAVLGRPLTYQWLYYSDFLQSMDSHEAIMASLTWKMVIGFVSVCLMYPMFSIALGYWIDRERPRLSKRKRHLASALVWVGALSYVAVGQWYLESRGWPYNKLVNPVYEFGRSWAVSGRQPLLFTMKTSSDDAELTPPMQSSPSMRPYSPTAIKHVVLFVLESTPAQYLGAYGSKCLATPNIDRWSKHAAVFESIYAHAPASNKSLFSILCSVYPWISYRAETEEIWEQPLPSMTSILKEHGYVCGFFSSGDLSYQGGEGFLSACGFNLIQDFKKRENARKIFTNKRWSFLDGSDDISTTDSLTEWFEEQHKLNTPIFAMLWTNMTHYPYFTEEDHHELGTKENLFNHYLNALHYGDRAFGKLMTWLEERRLVNETLVIVVGDHGEAFGQHGQLTHANNIYEENCHVPLLLINPMLFTGQHLPAVGGMVDIAPTIAEILGYPPAITWQGRSLFSATRLNRTYFFAPWSDYRFGYRDNNIKFIYDATKNSYEMYDLSVDSTEERNLVATHGDQIAQHLQRIAAWVQNQNRVFNKLRRRSNPPSAGSKPHRVSAPF